jgi:hypothetical protein
VPVVRALRPGLTSYTVLFDRREATARGGRSRPGGCRPTCHWALWNGTGPGARPRAAERVEPDDECSAHRLTDEMCGVTVSVTRTSPAGGEPWFGGWASTAGGRRPLSFLVFVLRALRSIQSRCARW